MPHRACLEYLRLWHSLVVVLAAWALVDGAGFAFAPLRYTSSATFAVAHTFPGIRVLGWAYLALGAGLLYSLGRYGDGRGIKAVPMAYTLAAGIGYHLWWLVTVAASWALYGPVAWPAATKYTALMVIYVLLWWRRPHPRA